MTKYVSTLFRALGYALFLAGCSDGDRVNDGSDSEIGEASRAKDADSVRETPAQTMPTLFRAIDSGRSGLDFVNRGPPVEKNAQGEIVRFRSMSGADTTGGVTVGDYDGDGLPDIYLTRSVGGNRLYRNLGHLRFEDVTESAKLVSGPAWGTGASFVDIDNDGDLDLYACGYQCANCLYINQGNGSFVENAAAFRLDFQGASVMPAFADFDCDGDADLYLLTNHLETPGEMDRAPVQVNPKTREVTVPPDKREVMGAILKPDNTVHAFLAGQFDHLYENEPNPGGRHPVFSDVTAAAGIRGAHMGLSATWWDYNDDQFPDIYVANDFFGPDHLYRNNRDGTFTDVIARAIPHTPWYSMGSDAGDLNNDGRPDYMASDMAGSDHYRSKMAMGDMASLAWFLETPVPRQYMRNAVYINTGVERFQEAARMCGLAGTDWTWSVRLADLDNDGWKDVFVTNGMTRDLFHSDLKEREQQLASQDQVGRFWGEAPEKRDTNLVFRNLGDLKFAETGREWGLNHTGISYGAATADLDGDGDLDLVVNHYGEPSTVYENQSKQNWLRVRLIGEEGSHSQNLGARAFLTLESGEVRTEEISLARGYMSTSEPLIHFGLGESGTDSVRHLEIRWPGGTVQRISDVPANQILTVYEKDAGDPVPTKTKPPLYQSYNILSKRGLVEEAFDDFARQPLLPHRLSQDGPAMAWGDVDGDGLEDCYLGRSAGKGGAIYFNKGPGHPERQFEVRSRQPFDKDAASEDMGALFFDANDDGHLDLYVASGSIECEPGDDVLRDRLYLNQGEGNYIKAPSSVMPDIRSSGSCVCAADFDRDGDLDLFVGGRSVPGRWPETPQSHLLINEGGRFNETLTKEIAPGLASAGMVTGALWSDCDNDGWQDLFVTTEWGTVQCWHNEARDGGRRLHNVSTEVGLAAHTGWWNGIAAADIDHDGYFDYLAANHGLNTGYHASREHPLKLYYGDVDGDGKPNIIEAEYEDDVLYPHRGFSCSRNAMPTLQKMETFHNFASAALDQIYQPERLDQALEFEVNTLSTGLILNASSPGQPAFRFKPLPRESQISPVYGAQFIDANLDTHPDVYLVQNSHNPQPETGRFDGGISQLYLGDGEGGFRKIGAAESGLVVQGDGQALSRTDLNGDGLEDLVCTINNEGVAAFVLSMQDNEQCLRIRLNAGTGNSTGIGSRATLVTTSGTRRTAEVRAGESYLSQSTAALSFAISEADPPSHIEVRWPNGSIEKVRLGRIPESRMLAIQKSP